MPHMKQSLSIRLELREGATTGFGGYSPHVEGLPIGEYQRLVPGIKVAYQDPDSLKCTDKGNDLEKIMELSEEWVKAIHKSVDTGTFEYPLICPVVVADVDDTYGGQYISLYNVILDGNSRVAAASLHTSQMPVIVIETPEDLANIRKLHKTGIFFWYHGGKGGKKDFRRLMTTAKEAEEAADIYGSGFLDDVIEKGYNDSREEMREGTGLYFNPNIFGDSSLKYCIGRVAFQEQLGKPTTLNRFVLEAEDEHDWDTDEYDADELAERRAGNRRNLQEEINKYNLRGRITQVVRGSGLKNVDYESIVNGTIEFLTCYVTDPVGSERRAEEAEKKFVKEMEDLIAKMRASKSEDSS